MKSYLSLLLAILFLMPVLPAVAAGEDISQRVSVSSIRFSAAGSEIFAITPGTAVTAECQVKRTQTGSGEQEIFLILQVLKNGRMVDLKKSAGVALPSGEVVTLRATAAPLGQDTDGCEITAFVAGDLESLLPLCPPARLGSGESRLHAVSLNGKEINLENGVFDYESDTQLMEVETEPFDQGARITVSQEDETLVLRVESQNKENSSVYRFYPRLLRWEDRKSIHRTVGTEWPFRPAKDYQSQQNPPDFSWPYIEDAVSYDLRVSRDPQMVEIVYRAENLENNYYNFPNPFETGIYYWSVRYRTEDNISEWTTPSRFLILPDAGEFTVSPIEDMLKKIPAGHPRIAVAQEELEAYRQIEAGQSFIDGLVTEVRDFMSESMPEEPAAIDELWERVSPMLARVNKGSIVYLIRQDPEIGSFAVSALLSLAEWDPEGVTSYENQDQIFRDILLSLVQGYDYLYDLLTEGDRQAVLSAIQARAVILEHPTEGLSDAVYKLKESPYQSHGVTALGYILQTALVTYGELPEAEQWLREYLPLYLNATPVWGNEDGGWSQGMNYAAASLPAGEDLRFTLYTHGIANLYQKAFYKNYDKFSAYFTGKYGGAEFGDGSTGIFSPDWALIFKTQAYLLKSPYAAWLRANCDYGASGTYANYYMTAFPWPEEQSLDELPSAAVFRDIGWVAMHSGLTDYDNRISAYFKSSPFGSYNHSHADQNSFVIQAYGERLAIDSGYYDYYHSPFDLGYTRKTYAHNAITMDDGIGQASMMMGAKGEITGFLHHKAFDLATGEAAEAYNYTMDESTGIPATTERLERATRHVVYLRPDLFLVIDDLKRSDAEKSSFEWWLNALGTITYNENTAQIQQGKAALDAVIQFPQGVKANYSETFSGPDGIAYTPSGNYASQPVHKRVWFSTPPANSSKIVATLAVHPAGTETQTVEAEQLDNVLKLSLKDDTSAFVNIGENSPMTVAGIETDAAAVVVQGDNYLMVEGSYLTVEGRNIFVSDIPISAAYGGKQLSLSCAEDAQVLVQTEKEVRRAILGNGKELPANDGSYGILWKAEGTEMRFNLYKGFYQIKIQ